MANPKWFSEVEYLSAKLAKLKDDGFRDPNGNEYTSISQVADAMAAAGMTAFQHYNEYGSEEGLSPSNAFNAVEYCTFKLNSLRTTGTEAQKAEWAGKTWQDVQYEIHKAGMSLGEHYSSYGFVEGVPMSNSFDGNKYLEAKLAKLQATEATAAAWKGKTVPELAAYFKANGIDPYTHYGLYGGADGEVPAGMTFKPEPVNPGGGEIKNLTYGVDNFTAGAQDTTFMGSSGTFTIGDRLIGGSGNDTLLLQDVTSVLPGAQTVQGVENVVMYNGKSDAVAVDMSQFTGMQKLSYTGTGSVNFKGVDTVTDVTLNSAATGNSLTGAGITNVTLKNMANGNSDATVAVHNSTAGHTTKLTLENVGVVNKVYDDSDDKGVQFQDNTAKSLDIVSNGTANVLELTTTATTANTVTESIAISGTGALFLDVSGGKFTGVKTIDGSTATGDLHIINVAAGTDSIKTGAGNDIIRMRLADFGANDKYEMGEGKDTLMLANKTNATTFNNGGVSFNDKTAENVKGLMASTGIDAFGVELITSGGAGAAGADGSNGAAYINVDMGLFKDTDIKTFFIDSDGGTTGSGFWGQTGGTGVSGANFTAEGGDGGNGMTFVSNNSSLRIVNSHDTDALVFQGASGGAGIDSTGAYGGGDGGHGLEITHYGTTDTVTLNFDGKVTFNGGVGGVSGGSNPANSLGGNGLEASQINYLDMVFADAATNVKFVGASGGDSGPKAADILIGSKGSITLTGVADKINLGEVLAGDGSAAGGNANTTIDASGLTAGKVMVETGAGNDTLTGGAGNDILMGGTAFTGGSNVFFGGKGNDYFAIGVTDNVTNTAIVTDVIKDFTHGEDKITIRTATATNEVAVKHSAAYTDLAALVTASDDAAGITIGVADGVVYVIGCQSAGIVTDIVKLEGITLAGIEVGDILSGTGLSSIITAFNA